MKYFGIDVGTRRIGIARSDEQNKFAFPSTVIQVQQRKGEFNVEAALQDVVLYIQKEGGEAAVLGDSQNSKGVDNSIMVHVRKLKELLENEGIKVQLEPEYFTSQHAAHFQGEGPLHDASAAALILQRFLDKINYTHE